MAGPSGRCPVCLCRHTLHRCQLGNTAAMVAAHHAFLATIAVTIVGLLLQWWLLTMHFHKIVAGLLLRRWLLTIRLLCVCFCAWAASGVLLLQGHHFCRALSPFCFCFGWPYIAYFVLHSCPAKPASGRFAVVHGGWAAPPVVRSASFMYRPCSKESKHFLHCSCTSLQYTLYCSLLFFKYSLYIS